MYSQKQLARLLRQTAIEVETNKNCGTDDEDLETLAAFLNHRKRNIEQICQDYGISRATLTRWQDKGKLPPFRKDSGGKCFLFRDEIEESLRKWNETHDE